MIPRYSCNSRPSRAISRRRSFWNSGMRGACRLLALSLMLVTAGAARAQAPLTVRAGWANTPSTMTPLLFLKKDILRHYGQSYVVEPVRFGGTSPEITALSAGELDVATLAFSSFGAAV